MTRANKLGAVSFGFFVLMFLGVRSDLVIVVCAFFAIVLGIVAGTKGNKWWFAIPCITAALVGVMIWAGFTAS
jgi:hypothetical protein